MEDPKKYLKSIFDKGIEFFDYHKLDGNAWRAYYTDSQFISKNEVFNNEIFHFMKDLMEKAILESDDFQQVMHCRTAIITLETLKKRLQEIDDPDKKQSNEEPFSGI